MAISMHAQHQTFSYEENRLPQAVSRSHPGLLRLMPEICLERSSYGYPAKPDLGRSLTKVGQREGSESGHHGQVRDLIISADGELKAVIVSPKVG